MKSSKNGFLSRFRRSDKIILGVIAALVLVTIVLNVMDRLGLRLANGALMFYLPVAALLALVGWGAYALIRRLKSTAVKALVGGLVVLALMLVVTVGFTYLSLVTYTALPHVYKTLADPSGQHKLAVVWQFDSDVERNETSIAARKAARLEAYPDSDPETLADDVTVAFEAYPSALFGLFYRSNADVEGRVFLAYTKNVAPMNSLEVPAEAQATEAPAEAGQAEEAVGAQATGAPAEPVLIDTPHGTLMLEWLDDNRTAHFYVQDPGVAEGGECTVRF